MTSHVIDPSDVAAAAPGLLRYAGTLTPDGALAEDLVQSTLLRALERADGYRGDSSLQTWLHRILHNLFIDHVRTDREVPDAEVWQRVETRWQDPTSTFDAALLAESSHTVGEVRDALVRLPINHRRAVALHDMEGLTVPEVAEVLGIGLSAAKQRVSRGRLMLVTALNRSAERREAGAHVPGECWSVRTRVSEYLDDELTAAEAALLQAHVASCPTCPPLYSAMVASVAAVAELRDPDTVIPPGLARRLGALRGESS